MSDETDLMMLSHEADMLAKGTGQDYRLCLEELYHLAKSNGNSHLKSLFNDHLASFDFSDKYSNSHSNERGCVMNKAQGKS